MSSDPLRRPTDVELIDAGALLAMLMIAMWTFRSSYGGLLFLGVGLVSALVGLALAWLAFVRRWPLVVTAACALIVYIALSTWFALRHYALFGLIPTSRSMLETMTSTATAWKELITTTPPVGSTGDLMIIPVFLCFFGALLSYSVARRVRYAAPVLVTPLVITGLGIAVGVNTPVSLIINGAVLGVVMVAWVAWRENLRRASSLGETSEYRRVAVAAVLLGLAAVLGFVLAPVLPGDDGPRAIWRQTVIPPFDPRVYPSPLAGYRGYVKPGYDAAGQPNPDKVMFTIEGLPAEVPVRLATMDSYDGLVWQVSGGDPDDPSLRDSGSFERIGASVAPDIDGQRATVTITIREYADVWVPDVGEVISIKFEGSAGGPTRDRQLIDSLRYNRATDTAATPIKLQQGDRYVLEVRLPNPLERLEGAQIEPKVPNLGTARSVPEVTQTLATPDVLVLNDSGARLDKIRDLMVTTGAYSDGDKQANQIMVTSGHNDARLSAFIGDFPRRPFIGNAEQFSAAYALLFRDLGNVPTRVVMGFIPSRSSQTEPVDVVQTDVEAWVEVPVSGLGWVAIFPTPPREQVSSSTSAPQQPDPDYKTQNPPSPPLVDPEFTQPAKAEGNATNPTEPEDETRTDPEPGPTEPKLWESPAARRTALFASPLLLIALVAMLIVLVKWIRRGRRRRRGPTHLRIARGWQEVTDLSADLGRPVPSTTTRQEAASYVGESSVALAVRTDEAVWSGAELSDADVDAYWLELRSALKSIRTEAPIPRRIRSYFSIQSLKRQKKRGERERDH